MIIRAARRGLACALLGALALAGCRCFAPASQPATQPTVISARYEPAAADLLARLGDDEIAAALPALRQSCAGWERRHGAATLAWQAVCSRIDAGAGDGATLRRLLADCCDAWRIVADERVAPAAGGFAGPPRPCCDRRDIEHRSGLMTGYFEPELHGSRARGGAYPFPLYGVPPDLLTIDLADLVPELKGRNLRGRLVSSAQGARVVPYWTRADIVQGRGAQGAEILWVDDELAAFFVQVQGSGRVDLDDGSVVRIGYADTNGQPYRSIGRWLVERGELTVEEATVPGIEAWAHAHPDRIEELLDANPSFVFFRELPIGDPAAGPVGAFGVPLTADHSLAVDPRFVPLGTPVITVREGADGVATEARLALAQDTGGAIRGPLRFDLYRGSGAPAGSAAGVQRDQVDAWLLLPKGIRPEDLLAPARPG